MEESINIKLVAKHITEGTLEEQLCRLCLMPLTVGYENIFTKVCKMDEEYCIADILRLLCDVQFSDNDQYNVCCDCFTSASNAYKFYLNSRKVENILNYVTDNLLFSINDLKITENDSKQSLRLVLPTHHTMNTEVKFEHEVKIEETDIILLNQHYANNMKIEQQTQDDAANAVEEMEKHSEKQNDNEEELVVIMSETGLPVFLKMLPNGTLVEIEPDDQCRNAYKLIVEKRNRKPRHVGPMSLKACSQCPTEYRYIAKLRDHMLLEHHILLYVCKLCKALCEGSEDYKFHLGTHTKEYVCDKCGIIFKKRNSIISHMASHEKIRDTNEIKMSFVCTECGYICADADTYNAHSAMHTEKPFTCYYCGRMFKREKGFNNHIKKHETYLKKNESTQEQISPAKSKVKSKQKPQQDFRCAICGKRFLGQRALDWHGMLHTNERPFSCDVCGKGFISLNRRNQHTLCAHSAPARRCPLCPALFHMRSMVNSHIKKVHLNLHKRRRRPVRVRDVSWHTETVPIQELSVAIQNEILEMDLRPTL